MSKLEDKFATTIRLVCLSVGCAQPEREYVFARGLKRRWRFDFAWPELMLAIEVDGGTARGGRHTSVAGFREDCHKGNAAALLGWTVLHGDSSMVTSGQLATYAEDALRERKAPSLRGPKPYLLARFKR
jgi:hypothetical protein